MTGSSATVARYYPYGLIVISLLHVEIPFSDDLMTIFFQRKFRTIQVTVDDLSFSLEFPEDSSTIFVVKAPDDVRDDPCYSVTVPDDLSDDLIFSVSCWTFQ